ncbi:MAG: glycoside hydrolase family 16 protein [Phycisphaerales bacterium]|nr:glycoside hydrolase family 16 protein [Phycisphaerales bacterium]
MLYTTLLVLFLLHNQHIQPTAQIGDSGYELVWSDGFTGEKLDSKKWMHRMKDGMHGKSRIREHCSVLDGKGHVVLKTQLVLDDSEVGYKIESGMIATQGLHEWKYGLFEARIKFESAQGHHGAFWLQSPEYGSVTDDFEASGTEIDIIEYFGRKGSLSQNVHWNTYGSEAKKAKGSGDLHENPAIPTVDTEFHVYSLLWTPDEHIFYIDGKETWRFDEAISKHNEYIILSVLTSNWEAKKVKPENFPDSMVVDWVRVFQKK